MMRVILLATILALVLVLGAGSIILTGNVIKETNSIKIGFIGPLSGGPALWGMGARNLVELAVSEINEAGGINGKLIEVIYEDGKCSPKEAVGASNKLINSDGIKFIIGGHCSPETAAIVPIIDQSNVFLLAGITSADNAVSGSDYAFRTSPPTIESTDIMAEIAIKDYSTISLITEQAAYSKSYSDDLVISFEKVGGKVLSHIEHAPGQTDFRTELLKIKDQNPDAIFISPQDPKTSVNVLKQMKELGIDKPVFANTIMVVPEVYELSDHGFDERTFSITPYADKKTKEAVELNEKYKERYETDIPYNFFYVASAYDSVYMLAEGLKKCGEDPNCVKEYFKTINYSGVTGNYRFKENGDPYFNSWAEMRVIDSEQVLIPV